MLGKTGLPLGLQSKNTWCVSKLLVGFHQYSIFLGLKPCYKSLKEETLQNCLFSYSFESWSMLWSFVQADGDLLCFVNFQPHNKCGTKKSERPTVVVDTAAEEITKIITGLMLFLTLSCFGLVIKCYDLVSGYAGISLDLFALCYENCLLFVSNYSEYFNFFCSILLPCLAFPACKLLARTPTELLVIPCALLELTGASTVKISNF